MEPKAKILFADDEPDILDIIGFNLEKEGYEVITANNGQQAFDLSKIHRPDLIILDIMMPYKTGIEVCNLLRQLPDFRDTPIVILTALNDETSHIKGLDSGADDYRRYGD
ncbi:MAG: response regulator [Chitinophagaceae bacterium]|nr:response regulator [Chitinophagaceae bacterium]